MFPVSSRFVNTLRASHRLDVETLAYAPGDPLHGERLPVVGGSVSIDRTSRVRSRASLSVLGADYYPRSSTDLLAPYGAIFTVSRGIAYADGSSERVPLGTFRVETVALDVSEGIVSVEASDRFAQIEDERFTTPYAPTRYERHVDVIRDLVLEVYPDIDVEQAAISSTIGNPIFDEDRAGAIDELATAIGCECYFDRLGDFVIAEIVPPTSTSWVWSVDAGSRGVMVDGSKRLAREGAYNGVLARGATTAGAPVSSLVVDDRSGSPTLWGGPFGRVPRFYESPLILTAAQAQVAATKLLQRSTGLDEAIEATSIPNPALDVGDSVLVRWPDGTADVHAVEAITVPLDVSETMTVRCAKAITLSPVEIMREDAA
jgi:hypothetical protein